MNVENKVFVCMLNSATGVVRLWVKISGNYRDFYVEDRAVCTEDLIMMQEYAPVDGRTIDEVVDAVLGSDIAYEAGLFLECEGTTSVEYFKTFDKALAYAQTLDDDQFVTSYVNPIMIM